MFVWSTDIRYSSFFGLKGNGPIGGITQKPRDQFISNSKLAVPDRLVVVTAFVSLRSDWSLDKISALIVLPACGCPSFSR